MASKSSLVVTASTAKTCQFYTHRPLTRSIKAAIECKEALATGINFWAADVEKEIRELRGVII